MTAPHIVTGHASTRIDREATTEVDFGFTPPVMRRAFKPLFTMLL